MIGFSAVVVLGRFFHHRRRLGRLHLGRIDRRFAEDALQFLKRHFARLERPFEHLQRGFSGNRFDDGCSSFRR